MEKKNRFDQMQEIDPTLVKKSLVENAFRFLNRSVTEFEASIQFSMINFFSSIELFFKAKLLDEHWTLTYEKPEDATTAGFLKGDFKSVSLNTAIKRLKNISGFNLPDQEGKCFESIRQHRNKAVHFFHELEAPALESLKEEVASLQCQGWHYLQDLLANKWKKSFQQFSHQIEFSNRLMLGQRKYLENKFARKKNEIQNLILTGNEIGKCYFCDFASGRITQLLGPLVKMECLVCEHLETFITAPCPVCSHEIFSYELGVGVCEECQNVCEIKDFKEIFDQISSSLSDIAFEEKYATCSKCEYLKEPTVITIESKYICLNCHAVDNNIFFCDVCSGMATGEDNYLDVNICSKCIR